MEAEINLTFTVSAATLIALIVFFWRAGQWEADRRNREVALTEKIAETKITLKDEIASTRSELKREIGEVRDDLAEHTSREEKRLAEIDHQLRTDAVWRKESEMDRAAIHRELEQVAGRKARSNTPSAQGA